MNKPASALTVGDKTSKWEVMVITPVGDQIPGFHTALVRLHGGGYENRRFRPTHVLSII